MMPPTATAAAVTTVAAVTIASRARDRFRPRLWARSLAASQRVQRARQHPQGGQPGDDERRSDSQMRPAPPAQPAHQPGKDLVQVAVAEEHQQRHARRKQRAERRAGQQQVDRRRPPAVLGEQRTPAPPPPARRRTRPACGRANPSDDRQRRAQRRAARCADDERVGQRVAEDRLVGRRPRSPAPRRWRSPAAHGPAAGPR